MPALIFGVLVLVLALWALNVISKADPRIAARVTKIGGGLLSLALAVFLGLRGEIGVAIPLGAFGLGLLGWVPFGPAGFGARTQKTGGQTPRNFGIDPTGGYVLAANQASDTVVPFQVDQETGELKQIAEPLAVPAPVCVKFVPLEE